jgi:hypothetical protein
MPHEPIKLHPDNPHYFLFRSAPTILITSAEHYGAVINSEFDYIPYLDTLQSYGFNLTRLFSGAYVERRDTLGQWNTLAPKTGRLIAPWSRSETPGYAEGGNLFDLDRWDGVYFARLRDFVAEAGRRGIVVEYVFFSNIYTEFNWEASPLNCRNNVNGVSEAPFQQFTTLADHHLIARQEQLIRKIAFELRDYDNLYYEICNEPPYIDGAHGTLAWHNHLIDTLVDAESSFAQPHMIAADYDQAPLIENMHSALSICNSHYGHGHNWIAAIDLLDRYRDTLGRAIAFDETADVDMDNTLTGVRTEGWEFMIGGGAVYDHLSWAYTVEDPSGADSSVGVCVNRQLQILKDFFGALDLIRMAPDPDAFVAVSPEDIRVRVLAEPGRTYAVYLVGRRRANLVLRLPPGGYQIRWHDTKSGRIVQEETCTHPGGDLRLASPWYLVDIALRIDRITPGISC